MAFDFQNWFEKKQNDNLVFSYRGVISSESITKVLESIESRIDEVEENSKLKRKLYNVLVEGLQNMYHHTEIYENSEINMYGTNFEGDTNIKFGSIFLEKFNSYYKVTTGNYVKREKVQPLKDKLDQINALTVDEVKSLYKLILNNLEFSDRGGGGLGLIDITKRIENKLIYYFFDLDEEIAFYCLEININK